MADGEQGSLTFAPGTPPLGLTRNYVFELPTGGGGGEEGGAPGDGRASAAAGGIGLLLLLVICGILSLTRLKLWWQPLLTRLRGSRVSSQLAGAVVGYGSLQEREDGSVGREVGDASL